jgi:RNA polymerase sigma factor (sigma-70 family)
MATSTVELKARRFEQLIVPHLDSAYNLARWLTRSDADARDIVQEACLRAFRYFDSFGGQYANAWLLKIVRNTCYSWLHAQRSAEAAIALEENLDRVDQDTTALWANAQGFGRSPERILAEKRDAWLLAELLAQLPPVYREVVVLREIDDLSYREIAEIIDVRIGTVMSRLSRGRKMLQRASRARGYRGERG